jgi:hypothetical protein
MSIFISAGNLLILTVFLDCFYDLPGTDENTIGRRSRRGRRAVREMSLHFCKLIT